MQKHPLPNEIEVCGLLDDDECGSDQIEIATSPPFLKHKIPRTFLDSLADSMPTLILVCTIVDFFLLATLCTIHFMAYLPPMAWKSIDDVPLRSTYLNFDKIYRNSSFPRGKFQPIVNHAKEFYQVSSKDGERDKVIDVWADLRFSQVGLLPRYGQHLIVNSTVSV